jgi:competence protein ComFC
MMLNILKAAASFVLPEVCICCEKLLSDRERFVCFDCSSKLERLENNAPVRQKLSPGGNIDYAHSLYRFKEDTEIQTIIHAFKYGQLKSIGVIYGRQLGEIVMKFEFPFDLIIPVPLHKAKKRERTYNQSEYICHGINEVTGIKVMQDCLKRIRYTESQTKLKLPERKKNVNGAFRLNEKHAGEVSGKNIILVDDLITTGSTISECARVLKSVGCGKILACSIAVAG